MPKTLRPPASVSRTRLQQQQGGTPSGVTGPQQLQQEQQLQQQQQVVHGDVNPGTRASSSAAAAAAVSPRPSTDPSNSDVPDSRAAGVQLDRLVSPSPPPPLPSSPPPPPPPPLLGKPPALTGLAVTTTDQSVRPVLKSASAESNASLHGKPPAAAAAAAAVDLPAIEAARLRLKKTPRPETSLTCRFLFIFDVSFVCS